MVTRFIFSVIVLFFASLNLSYGQETYTLSGSVKDSANGEAMIGAVVTVKEINAGTATDINGDFSMKVPPGKYTVEINFVGYGSISQSVVVKGNTKMSFSMKEQMLKEVIVTGERPDAQVKNLEMGTQKLDMKQINAIPPLLGEVDVIRSIQLLPGVSTVGEGASGFNVRGGAVDQNLILLDDAPIYNSSHMFGFFSVFNPDMVKDIKLSKAAIPAQYGGRLSSVLDVKMKEGNPDKIGVQGGISTIFSRLTVGGPIKKNKLSFIVAGRRSYADVLARPFLAKAFKDAQLYFYDLTLKANYNINQRNRLYLSGYYGRDVFAFPGAYFGWGNATTTLRWNHVFSDKLLLNMIGDYSSYSYRLEFGEDMTEDSFKWTAKIINYCAKPEFTWYLNSNNTISFGAQATYYKFVPSTGVFYSGGERRDIGLPDKYAMENALYISNEQKLTARLTLQYGLRYSFFNYLGSGTAYYYDSTAGNYVRNPVGIEEFGRRKTIKAYTRPEPRIAANYSLSENSSLKASYNRMVQYIHLISNTTASIPLDVYLPSTNNIKPQLCDQYSLGYFRNIGPKQNIETSAEVFYKDMLNQLDYIDGANLFFNPNLEGEVIPGTARAYGLELFVKKKEGRFNGWISYTLSKSERKVPGINQGDWYPNRYDRRHNLSVVGIYELSKRVSLSSTFVYASGTPFTFATDKFEFQGIFVPYNPGGPRNNYRLPAYHRLDVAATLKSKEKVRKSKIFGRYSWDLVFTVYNLYSRRNAFAITPRQNPENQQISEALRFSIFGSFVPAITYNFKF
ncbi:MAG: carboxypeptidase-like regulatory domain-containing protein [Sporocytophaga sp.]|uniref:TonB-dependent receptor n=1 Tax=Sporocytophaga sp. TaxID=2231183 RepID=UPI001B29A12C|nr:TonB-dependent receptor [Sporocytophaga sp.]MBO9702835.1 carboxypeptidase-like regulatory domain-containing protein [Sporocytophaga sp.]